MKRILGLFLLCNVTYSWSNLKSTWQKGNFHIVRFPTHGRVQHLTIKNSGKLNAFYNLDQKQVIVRFSGKELCLYRSLSHVVDLDVDMNEDAVVPHHVVAYYSARADAYMVHSSFKKDPLLISPSPVKRCIIYQTNVIVVTSDGLVHVFSNMTDAVYRQETFSCPNHVFMVEYYHPFLYMVDVHHNIHLYCVETNCMSRGVAPSFASPVLHFHAHPTYRANEFRVIVAMQNGNVESFLIRHGKRLIEEEGHYLKDVSFETAGSRKITRIYADMYKCLCLMENGALMAHDCVTGEFWYQIHDICNPNFVTRMFASHRVIVVDGVDGITLYDIMKKGKEQISDWVSSPVRTPPSGSTFLKALMESPPYQFNSTNNEES